MTDFHSSSQNLSVSTCDWLSEARKASSVVWQNWSWPTRKTEDWKYTHLGQIAKRDFTLAHATQPTAVDSSLCANIADLNAIKVVFINGEYSEAHSQISKIEGLEIVRFSDASTQQQQDITAKLNSTFELEKHGFGALNTKLLSDGMYICVAKNTVLTQPIQIVSLTTQLSVDTYVNARALITIESGACATVVESFVSDDASQRGFTNSITECIIQDNAALTHYRLQEEQEDALHVGGVHATLYRNARLHSFYLAMGSVLKRVDVSVNYAGEGAEANINGVYLPKNKQHVDFHTCVEHAVPHCTTNEVFRGIIADEARAVFAGRIHIHRDAQKTEAYLSNKNLLTSNKAEIDTKPELEIYADDVRCAHGATIAQLDPLSVHYLKTRGISEEEAKVMLNFGFINELINELKDEAITQYLRPKLAVLFARDPELLRHLV